MRLRFLLIFICAVSLPACREQGMAYPFASVKYGYVGGYRIDDSTRVLIVDDPKQPTSELDVPIDAFHVSAPNHDGQLEGVGCIVQVHLLQPARVRDLRLCCEITGESTLKNRGHAQLLIEIGGQQVRILLAESGPFNLSFSLKDDEQKCMNNSQPRLIPLTVQMLLLPLGPAESSVDIQMSHLHLKMTPELIPFRCPQRPAVK